MRRAACLLVVLVMIVGCSAEDSTSTSGGSASAREMSLTPTGIGRVDFGTAPEATIETFSALIGGRDEDYEWTAQPIFGDCPGVLTRGVTWGSLVALFTDDGEGNQEFFAWTYGYDPVTGTSGVDSRQLGLRTLEGAGLGSTRAELESIYGTRLVETEDVSIEVWGFAIDVDQTQYLRGILSGPEDDAVVVLIESAPGCEPRLTE